MKIRDLFDTVNSIKDNHRVRKVAVNSSWIMLDKIYALVLGVFVTSVIARYFGPDQYGLFSYAFSLVSLFSVFSTLGLETLSVKTIVEKEENEGTILGTSLILRIIGSVFLVFAAYVTVQIIEPEDQTLKIMVLILSLLIMLKSFEVIEYWIQANHKAKISAKIRIISFTIISALKVFLVMQKGTLINYSFIYLFEAAFISFFLILAYRKVSDRKEKWHFKFTYAKMILSQSWYIMMSGMMITLFSKIDQIMLGSMMPTKTELGIYSAALKITTMWYFIPIAIITSFKPIVMNSNVDSKITDERTQLLYNIVTWVGIAFGVVIALFSNIIVSVIFGPDFAKSASVLNISIWAGTFATLGSARSLWLIKEGLQKYSLYSTAIGFIVNVILNYFMIPVIGAYGAALATLITQIIVNVVVFLFFKETRKSSFMIIKSFNIYKVIKSVKEIKHM